MSLARSFNAAHADMPGFAMAAAVTSSNSSGVLPIQARRIAGKKSAGGANKASRSNFNFDPGITRSPVRVRAWPPASASSVTAPIEWPIPAIGRSDLKYSAADASSRRTRRSSSSLVGINEVSISKCGAMTVHMPHIAGTHCFRVNAFAPRPGRDLPAIDHQTPCPIRRWRSASRELVLGCGPNGGKAGSEPPGS